MHWWHVREVEWSPFQGRFLLKASPIYQTIISPMRGTLQDRPFFSFNVSTMADIDKNYVFIYYFNWEWPAKKSRGVISVTFPNKPCGVGLNTKQRRWYFREHPDIRLSPHVIYTRFSPLERVHNLLHSREFHSLGLYDTNSSHFQRNHGSAKNPRDGAFSKG